MPTDCIAYGNNSVDNLLYFFLTSASLPSRNSISLWVSTKSLPRSAISVSLLFSGIIAKQFSIGLHSNAVNSKGWHILMCLSPHYGIVSTHPSNLYLFYVGIF